MDLYHLLEHCGYGSLLNEMICKHSVLGLRDTTLSEKLQLDPYLNFSLKQEQTS